MSPICYSRVQLRGNERSQFGLRLAPVGRALSGSFLEKVSCCRSSAPSPVCSLPGGELIFFVFSVHTMFRDSAKSRLTRRSFPSHLSPQFSVRSCSHWFQRSK